MKHLARRLAPVAFTLCLSAAVATVALANIPAARTGW
jgi:hypothetical protein